MSSIPGTHSTKYIMHREHTDQGKNEESECNKKIHFWFILVGDAETFFNL
jgi:hypothetical protein